MWHCYQICSWESYLVGPGLLMKRYSQAALLRQAGAGDVALSPALLNPREWRQLKQSFAPWPGHSPAPSLKLADMCRQSTHLLSSWSQWACTVKTFSAAFLKTASMPCPLHSTAALLKPMGMHNPHGGFPLISPGPGGQRGWCSWAPQECNYWKDSS